MNKGKEEQEETLPMVLTTVTDVVVDVLEWMDENDTMDDNNDTVASDKWLKQNT